MNEEEATPIKKARPLIGQFKFKPDGVNSVQKPQGSSLRSKSSVPAYLVNCHTCLHRHCLFWVQLFHQLQLEDAFLATLESPWYYIMSIPQ